MKAFIVHAWLLSGSSSNVEVLDIISTYKGGYQHDFDFDLDIMTSPDLMKIKEITDIAMNH